MSRDYICLVKKLLLPFSWVYGLITSVRNMMFDKGLLKETEFPVPLIGIGNLRVGGTGKTPLTIYLASCLSKDFAVTILSRGYGRRTKGYIKASGSMGAAELGDEPALIKRKIPEVNVVVSESRVHGVEQILAEPSLPDCILLDDVMQHRWVKPGLMLMLTAYHDMFYDDYVLPAGMLREPRNGYVRADAIIVSKCPPDLNDTQRRAIVDRLKLRPNQRAFFSYESYGQATSSAGDVLEANSHVVLVTGLGDASKIKEYTDATFTLVAHSEFSDHHVYTEADLEHLRSYLNMDIKVVFLTTGKDHQRMIPLLKNEKFAALPIYTLNHEAAFFAQDRDLFDQTIIDYVTSNSGNG